MGCGTIAALSLAGAGAGVGEYANIATNHAMNAKVQAEMERQRQFAQRGNSLFQQSLGQSGSDAANQQIGQGVQQTLGATAPASKIPFGTASVPLPGSGDALAQLQLQSQLGRAQQANANLQGFGNYGFQQGLKDQAIGSQLGVVGNEARQSAGVLPTELQQAQGSQAGLSALGQLLGVAGLLTGLGSMIPAAPAASSLAAPGAFDASLAGSGAWGWAPSISGPGLSLDTTYFPGFTGGFLQ